MGFSRRRGIDPDRALQISLGAGASRMLHTEHLPRETVVERLRELAGGRGDLLAEAAGSHLGGWLAEPDMHPFALASFAVLVEAGATLDAIPAVVDRVREAATPRPGMTPWDVTGPPPGVSSLG